MKKLFAIILTFALLIPLCVTTQAEAVEKAPFYMTNWVIPTVDCDYVYGAAFLHASTTATQHSFDQGIFDARLQGLSGATIADMAASLKEEFDTYPDGCRYISFSALHKAIHDWAEICFAEGVAERVAEWLDAFLKEYNSIGGKLDGLNIDIEYTNIYPFYINSNFAKKDPLVYSKIEQMSAYQEKIRPMLVERGFKFYDKVTELTPEIYAIHPNSGSQYAISRSIWSTVMRNYIASVVEEACAPLFTYYPDAMLSDYRSKDVLPWVGVFADDGGYEAGGGIRYATGNAGNEMFYSVRPGTSFFKDGNEREYSVMPGSTDAVYENTIFERLQYDVNVAKSSYLASSNGRINWVTAHQYYHEEYAYNAYYTESMYHFGLLNPEVFLGYIIAQDCTTGGDRDAEKLDKAFETADDIMEELSRVAGYADRKPIAVSSDWNHGFILSGMYANGRNIWRITPDDNMVSLENFKVDGTDPTFKVGNETVTFPGGKIIEDGKISDVGSYGYWVETAADVMPVITRIDDYYRLSEGYQENYDSFEAGMEYVFAKTEPAGCWEPKKQGSGSAFVVADPANAQSNVLALKGNFSVRNVKLPANIWGGDSYAEHQGWEISFTLPADMPADAELILLNASNEKKTAKDGGIKIVGTKVYYSNATDYVEMEGVTLTNGAKYTAIRDMDFTNEEALICNYYIYGADGTLVGQAKNIAIDKLVLPVYGVGFSCKGVTGEAVLMDDYRLYPTQVNYDFRLYNADTGMQNQEIEKAQSGNVAYRFTWLNATNTEKSYTVMAAYYDGETKLSEEVVKEIKMSPNADYVDFGVVENKQEGKSMLVYLKDNNPVEEEEILPPADTADKTGLDTTMLIIIAAAAVVVIAVVVIIIIASKKKKTKKNSDAE